MSKKSSEKSSSVDKPEDVGNYLWRGGQKIELEKEDDRFTIMPSDQKQLELANAVPGVRKIKPVTNQVYKVETTTTERDSAMDALRSDAYNVIVHHSYRPKNSKGTIYYISDKIIVRFKPNTTTNQIDQLLKKCGLNVLKEYETNQEDKKTYLLKVTSTSGENPVKIANRLATEKIIEFAEPNMVNRFQQSFIPTDTLFRNQWHLNAKTEPELLEAASVMAPVAWDVTRGRRNIVLAIIDDGFDLTHPDFQGSGKVVFPKDYVDGDSNPFPVKEHGDYHGTSCAGVAIAESNGVGVVGAAHGCAFMPVRFPLEADDDLLIEIFSQVAKKADVISCSWGPPPVYAPISSQMSDTIKTLTTTGGPRGKGCVICFAAGNYNARLNDSVNSEGIIWFDYSAGILRKTTGPILNGLAAHPNVIAVAASTSLNKHAAYSNWGQEISVCSPSNNFHPLDRQKHVPGRGIWTTDNEAYGSGFTPHSRYTGIFGGTSSATPLVAGVAALLLSANPQLTAAQVKKIMQATADKIVDADPDIILGTSRGKYDNKGHCDWFGFGKVNAASAVEAAKQQ
jgi:subtilisin family serine protease